MLYYVIIWIESFNLSDKNEGYFSPQRHKEHEEKQETSRMQILKF